MLITENSLHLFLIFFLFVESKNTTKSKVAREFILYPSINYRTNQKKINRSFLTQQISHIEKKCTCVTPYRFNLNCMYNRVYD